MYVIGRGELFHNGMSVPLWKITPRRVRTVAAARNGNQHNSCSPRPCMSLAAANYSTTVCLYRCGRSRRGEYVPLPRRETEINIILVRRGHVCHWPRRTIAQRYGVPLWKITPRRSQYVAAASVKKIDSFFTTGPSRCGNVEVSTTVLYRCGILRFHNGTRTVVESLHSGGFHNGTEPLWNHSTTVLYRCGIHCL